ncbi:UTP:RNA uridylyltransferase 1 [Linum grandiflorum]
MSGGGGGDPPPGQYSNGGEFLLSLLQRPTSHHPPSPSPSPSQPQFTTPFILPQPQQFRDPAVATVGQSYPYAPPPWGTNGLDLPSSSLPHGPLPPELLGFPPNHWPSSNQLQASQSRTLIDDLRRLGFPSIDAGVNAAINGLLQQQQQQQQVQQKLQFGSFQNDIQLVAAPAKDVEKVVANASLKGLANTPQLDGQLSTPIPRDLSYHEQDRSGGGGNWGRHQQQQQQQGGNYKAVQGQRKAAPPPGFSNQQRVANSDNGSRRRESDHNVARERVNQNDHSRREEWVKRSTASAEPGITRQLDRPGIPSGTNLPSVSGSEVEEAMTQLHSDIADEDDNGLDDHGEELVDSLLREVDLGDDSKDKKQSRNSRDKESRLDNRGQHMLNQRMRMIKRQQIQCRRDIERFNMPFLVIYESLIPPEEEKEKQKQLLTLLEKLVNKEWPEARLFLYGSCANSFGVSKSDVDVCLAIEDGDSNKSEILLRLADILQSDNLQNVQVNNIPFFAADLRKRR